MQYFFLYLEYHLNNVKKDNEQFYIILIKYIINNRNVTQTIIGNWSLYFDHKDNPGALAVAHVLQESTGLGINKIRIFIKKSFIRNFLKSSKTNKCKDNFINAINDFFDRFHTRVYIEQHKNFVFMKQLKRDLNAFQRRVLDTNEFDDFEEDVFLNNDERIEMDINLNNNLRNLYNIWRYKSHVFFNSNVNASIKYNLIIVKSEFNKRIDTPFLNEWELEDEELNIYVQNKCLTNVENIDNIIKSMKVKFNNNNFRLSYEDNMWTMSWSHSKIFTNYLWNVFLIKVVQNLLISKYDLIKYVDDDFHYIYYLYYVLFSQSKLPFDFWFFSQILFIHIDNVNTKQFTLLNLVNTILENLIFLFNNNKFNELMNWNIINQLSKINNTNVKKKNDKIVKNNDLIKINFNFFLKIIKNIVKLISFLQQVKCIPLTRDILFYINKIDSDTASPVHVKSYKDKIKSLSEDDNIKKFFKNFLDSLDKIKFIKIRCNKIWYDLAGNTIKHNIKNKKLDSIRRQLYFLFFVIDLLWNKSFDYNADVIDLVWETIMSLKYDWKNLIDISYVYHGAIEDNDNNHKTLWDIDVGEYEDEDELNLYSSNYDDDPFEDANFFI